jgi:hypothetical protein
MFIANPKRTFAEVRGLNSPAGATMVPAVPFVALDDPQDPAHQATIASGAENAVTAVSAATGPVSAVGIRPARAPSTSGLFPMLLSEALASFRRGGEARLLKRGRSYCGGAPRAAQRTTAAQRCMRRITFGRRPSWGAQTCLCPGEQITPPIQCARAEPPINGSMPPRRHSRQSGLGNWKPSFPESRCCLVSR